MRLRQGSEIVDSSGVAVSITVSAKDDTSELGVTDNELWKISDRKITLA